MVRGISSLPYEESSERLGMFSLRYRRLRGDVIAIFKYAHGQSTGYLMVVCLSLKIQVELEGISLGSSKRKAELGSVIFSRRPVGDWNKLL